MNWFRRNGWRLLVSLILSFFLWLFVTITTNPLATATFDDIPVIVRGLGAGLVIVEQDGLPRQDQVRLAAASLQVETDRNTLSSLRASDFQVGVDLTDLAAGVHVVPVDTATNVRNVRVLAVEPAEMSLRLEEIITATVPITIEVVGNLPFSFERDDPEVRSNGEIIAQATLLGPANLVRQVDRASATVNIEQLRATYVSLLELEPRDSNGDPVAGVAVSPERVSVEIRVRSVVGLKRVPVLANVVGIPAPGHIVTRVESTPALIDLVGSSSLLNTVDRIDTAPVEIAGATSTLSVTVPLRFRGAQPSDPDRTEVQVVVEIRAFDQPFQAQLPVAIDVIGANPSLLLSYTPRSVLGTFSAPTVDFLQFQSVALTATIDVTGLAPGTYNLVPQLFLPATVQLESPLPAVQVTLRAPATPTIPPTATPSATPPPTATLPDPATPTATPSPVTLPPEPTATPSPVTLPPEPTATPSPVTLPPEPTATLPSSPTSELAPSEPITSTQP